MKLVAAMIGVLLCASLAGAEDKPGAAYFFEHGKTAISVTKAEKYIEVKTEHTTYRIYPCGQLEKLVWKELNPNEDSITLLSASPNTVITTPYYYGTTATGSVGEVGQRGPLGPR